MIWTGPCRSRWFEGISRLSQGPELKAKGAQDCLVAAPFLCGRLPLSRLASLIWFSRLPAESERWPTSLRFLHGRCDMRVSLMRTLILRFAQSVQDAVHKKPQPLGRLMLGDSHDRLGECGGRRDGAGAPSFVSSTALWLAHREISPFYLPTLWHPSCAVLWGWGSWTLQENI